MLLIKNPHLTNACSESQDQMHRITHGGMAHFAGSGPPDKTCQSCKFKGYSRTSMKGRYDERSGALVHNSYRTSGCKKFYQLTGQHGQTFPSDTASCKYFAQK